MKVKAQKVGDSIILTVPKAFGVKNGEEYEVSQTNSGKIIYEPKDRNIFEGDWFDEDLKQKEMLVDRKIYDSEWDN